MSSPRARHAAAGAVAAAAAWLAFYAGWLVLAPGGERALLVFSDTAYLVPIAAAVLLSAWAATRVPKGLRGFWALISLACASWLAGEVLWSVFELRDKTVPFPWWTDVAYVGFYVLILAALVVFFRPSLRTIGGQAVLDGLLAVASLGLLWWGLVLRDLRLGSDPAALVGLSYPVLDLLLLCTIAATPLVSARRGTLAGWLVAAGVAVGGIADGVYAQLVLDRPLQLWPARRPRLAAAGVPDLPRRGRCGVRHRPRPGLGAAPVATPDPHGGEHERRADRDPGRARLRERARRAVGGGGGLRPRRRGAAARSGAGCSWSRRRATRRAATRSRASTTSPICTTSFVGSPRRQGSTGSRSRSCSCTSRGGTRTKRSAGSSGRRASSTSSHGSTTAGSQSFWRGSRSPARRRRPNACAPGSRPLRPPASRSGGQGDTSADVFAKAEQLLDAARQLGGNHTRGPQPDVLVHGQPRLGVTAFAQLLELAAAIDVRYRIAPAHSRKVAIVSRELALALELKPEAVAASYLGGLLHALGTLPLDESALRPARSADRARCQARAAPRHARRGARLPDPVRRPRRQDRGQLRGALGRRRAAAGAWRVDSVRGADRRGRERDRDDDRAGRRRAAVDLVADGDLATRRRPLRPRDRQRALPSRPRRAAHRSGRGGRGGGGRDR